MNKKAQAGPIALIFFVLIFIVLWFTFLGEWLNTVGQLTISLNNLTGIEAFFFANLNLWVLIFGLFLGSIGWLWFGSQQ